MRRPTHFDRRGAARMVDVGSKKTTLRTAVAAGRIAMNAAAYDAVRAGAAAKGDVLAVARVAGIAAAKKTADLIPLCHAVPLEHVAIEARFDDAARAVAIEATARARFTTGVEMEALVAVSAALLTIYDMVKAVDRAMTLGPIVLMLKSGGRSGDWRRPEAADRRAAGRRRPRTKGRRARSSR